MGLPGQSAQLVDTPPSPSQFTNISTLFAIGRTTSPVSLEEVHSYDQFEAAAGAYEPTMHMYDGMETFFKEGGSRAFFASVGIAGVDAALEAVLANFTKDLGPGAMTCFGGTSVVHVATMAQALATGRVALLDSVDTSVTATAVTNAGDCTGQPGDRFSAMFWPWDVIPGLTDGTTRKVPPSARIAGNLSRNDIAGLSSNTPAAGPNGIAKYVQGLSQPALSDANRTLMNAAGVNVSRIVLASVRTYGWRSLADQSTDSNWSLFSNSRCVTEILNLLEIMNENFVFSVMDGAGHNLAKYKSAIRGVVLPFWRDNDLFGNAPSEAFNIDTGPAYNTATSIANGELHGRLGLRFSPFAEMVEVDVAKYSVTDSVA